MFLGRGGDGFTQRRQRRGPAGGASFTSPERDAPHRQQVRRHLARPRRHRQHPSRSPTRTAARYSYSPEAINFNAPSFFSDPVLARHARRQFRRRRVHDQHPRAGRGRLRRRRRAASTTTAATSTSPVPRRWSCACRARQSRRHGRRLQRRRPAGHRGGLRQTRTISRAFTFSSTRSARRSIRSTPTISPRIRWATIPSATRCRRPFPA